MLSIYNNPNEKELKAWYLQTKDIVLFKDDTQLEKQYIVKIENRTNDFEDVEKVARETRYYKTRNAAMNYIRKLIG